MRDIGRREFIILLTGAAITRPRAVIAQTPSKVYRVGLLSSTAPVADNSPYGAPLVRVVPLDGQLLRRQRERPDQRILRGLGVVRRTMPPLKRV